MEKSTLSLFLSLYLSIKFLYFGFSLQIREEEALVLALLFTAKIKSF
uniref:Uncharacterized protein n=1 Tax=Rhizophora mucronata TaxID=61149 RepID=A0A2P2P4M0_RHIMU